MQNENENKFDIYVATYPMNIRCNFTLETHFGKIVGRSDWPAVLENELATGLGKLYFSLLNELYNEHERRVGKFPGDEGYADWLEENGKTIIYK